MSNKNINIENITLSIKVLLRCKPFLASFQIFNFDAFLFIENLMDTQEKITVKSANYNGERAVYLNIPDAKYKPTRYIGYIQNKTFFTYRNKNNQTFNKTSAIGINYKLLKQGAELFDYIVIKYGVDILQTTREYFLNSGYFLHFKNNGLERQIFLKIKDFGLDKVKQSENEKVIQLNYELTKFADVLKRTSLSMQEGLFQ